MSYTKESIQQMQLKAVAGFKVTKIFIHRLYRIQPQKLDKILLVQHNREFQKINCLECANCCKTISPGMYDSDIHRIAASVKMKLKHFIEKYLSLDEEGVYVFKQVPCPFLNPDNYCTIYKCRPKACREYPHTNRKRFYQILDLTARNSKICPAVFTIIENLKNNPNLI